MNLMCVENPWGKVVYLAAPYSCNDTADDSTRSKRYEEITKVAAHLSALGLNVYSPITHSHPMAVVGMQAPAVEWWHRDIPYMDMASALFVLCLPGWEQSDGVAFEIEHFRDSGKPVYYIDADLLEDKQIAAGDVGVGVGDGEEPIRLAGEAADRAA